VITQKRTMTRGSGQPLSSKWWCSGAIRKIRRPVSLNEATWRMTEASGDDSVKAIHDEIKQAIASVEPRIYAHEG
jgi:hypothetical protein